MQAKQSRFGRVRPILLGAAGVLVVAGALLWRAYGDATWVRIALESPYRGRCDKRVTRAALDRSLELGTRFMLAHQRREGNFDYEYDWKHKAYSEDDNEVRQAGALWGLALLNRDRPSAELAAGIERGLAYFEAHASENARGERCVAYPGKTDPGIGTVALVALTYVEYLSTPGLALAPERRSEHEKRLAAYLAELRAAMTPARLWFGSYDPATCAARGEPSPYSDGEALLALIKAAKYAGHAELVPVALRAADAGYALNVERALAADPDSDTTKGYYQWSTMSYYELATSGWPDTARFVDHALRLADWQVDVHRTLTRQRNTGYSYEGLIPAFELARRRGDTARADKLACVIDLGLERLLSWQVGGPLASSYTRDVDPNDRAAVGGVQNEKDEPPLRIDVTQHQLHAVVYARELVYRR